MIKDKILTKSNFKLWSKLGMRASFGMIAHELGESKEKLIILTADVSTSAGLDRFKKKFPSKYPDTGIAEQNLIGIAAGLSSEKFDVLTTTFAPFQTMRCCEQIKVNLGYMKQKIIMIGLASGLILGNLGYTHCCIEDIGVLRSIPNITIISPADPAELAKALIASFDHQNSIYIRLTGGSNVSQIYQEDYEFEIGKGIKIKSGEDLTIFSTGMMVKVAFDVSDILKNKNINAEVINMHTIKPIDEKLVKSAVKKNKPIFTIEEHNSIGGLGTTVSECIAKIGNAPKLTIFGINDSYSGGGDYEYLKNHFGLNAQSISKKIILSLKK